MRSPKLSKLYVSFLLTVMEQVENLLQQQPTPFLWCRLAELQDNVAYFESSWELSNHHYARAQRGLGKHYFYYKEYEECIKHYELAVCVLSNESMTS